MASVMLFCTSKVSAEASAGDSIAPPIDDLAFLLFLAEGFEEDGEWISEMDLETLPLESSSKGQEAPGTSEDKASEPLQPVNREGQP